MIKMWYGISLTVNLIAGIIYTAPQTFVRWHIGSPSNNDDNACEFIAKKTMKKKITKNSYINHISF